MRRLVEWWADLPAVIGVGSGVVVVMLALTGVALTLSGCRTGPGGEASEHLATFDDVDAGVRCYVTPGGSSLSCVRVRP